MSKLDDAKKAEDAKKAADAKKAEVERVEAEAKAEAAAKKKAESRMSDEEIDAFRSFYDGEEAKAAPHRMDIANGAATVVLLVEILKELRGQK